MQLVAASEHGHWGYEKVQGAYTVRHTRVSLHVYEWNRNKRCVLTLQRSTETAFDIKCFRHVNSHRLRLSKIKGPTGQTRTHTRIGNCEVDGLAVITKWAGSVRPVSYTHLTLPTILRV